MYRSRASPGTDIQGMLSEICFSSSVLTSFYKQHKHLCMPPVYFTVPYPRTGVWEVLAYVTPPLGSPALRSSDM